VHTNPSTGFDNCHGANPTSSNISQSAVLDWRKCEKRRYWLRESARKIRARRNSRAIVSIFSSWEPRVHSMKISDCGMRIADLNGACGVAGIGVTTLAEWRASQPDLEARMSEARERTRQKAPQAIKGAGEKDWRAHAEWLRLSFPADYRGSANKIEFNATASASSFFVTVEKQRELITLSLFRKRGNSTRRLGQLATRLKHASASLCQLAHNRNGAVLEINFIDGCETRRADHSSVSSNSKNALSSSSEWTM
jgi:hypothetical protein